MGGVVEGVVGVGYWDVWGFVNVNKCIIQFVCSLFVPLWE